MLLKRRSMDNRSSSKTYKTPKGSGELLESKHRISKIYSNKESLPKDSKAVL